MLTGSPYFNQHFPFNKKITSEMVFPNRIVVRPPVRRRERGHRQQHLRSDPRRNQLHGAGRAIEERRRWWPVRPGRRDVQLDRPPPEVALHGRQRAPARHGVPGVVQEVPGEFTDRKQLEAREELARTGKTGIFVYDRTVWQIKPKGTYGEKRFRLFLGDVARKPRILEEGTEVAPEDARLGHGGPGGVPLGVRARHAVGHP